MEHLAQIVFVEVFVAEFEKSGIVGLVREPHHSSINAVDGASKALDPGLISTVQPGLRS